MKNDRSRQTTLVWIFLAVLIACFAVYRFATLGTTPAASSTAVEATQTEPAPTQSRDQNMFHGYECSPDCSEQVEGYSYAENNNVKSRADCPSAPQVSDAYAEGCWAYADEQANGGSP